MNLYQQIDSNKRKSIFLVVIFVLIVLGLGWVFGEMYEAGTAGIILAVVIALFLSLLGYYRGDKVALLSAGAKPITKEENAYVYRMVENLCITAGLPKPNIYIIPDPNINAFATGRDPQHASIAVTTGAIEKLENEELEGVLAHELSHVKNYDIRFMTLVVVLVGVVAILSDIAIHSMWFGGGRKSRNSDSGGGALFVIGIILMILAPIIAQLIKFAVSRKREFLADSSAVLLTRYPEGLARALEKIASTNRVSMQKASNATAHLYIANPFGSTKRFFSKAFSTHPPVEERIKALRSM